MATSEAHIAAAVDAFRRLMRLLRVVARSGELATGLSAAQYLVLAAVAESPACSVNDIAIATMTDRSSVAAVVERLVEQRYVTRERARSDARRAAITITPDGRRAMRRAAPPPTDVLMSGLRDLPSRQLRDLSQALHELTRVLGIADEPGAESHGDGRARRSIPRREPPARQRRARK